MGRAIALTIATILLLAPRADLGQSPEPDSPDATRQKAALAHLAESTEWIQRCAENLWLRVEYLRAHAGADSPDDEIVAAAGALLSLAEGNPASNRFRPGPFFQVAKIYTERAIHLEMVPGLLEREATSATERERRRSKFTNNPSEEELARRRVSFLHSEWNRTSLLAEAQIKRQAGEDASQALGDLVGIVAELEELESDEMELRRITGYRATIWALHGRLAEEQGRAVDAIGFYREALALSPRDTETAERAKAIRLDQGGTEESWSRILGTKRDQSSGLIADASGWYEEEEPLPPFELEATDGTLWRSADLAGMTLFVNAWATWCVPCRAELPLVQALHDSLENRDDFLVLTLNVDQDRGLVVPFMRKLDLETTTLLAEEWSREAFGPLQIPKSWIVDPKGIVRWEQTGFDPTLEEGFVEDAVARMEAVRLGAGR